MWCFSPSRTALDCYARHLTVTGCFKSDRNDYPVAFPDDLLLCSSSIPAGNQLPCPVPTTPSDQPQFLLAALLVLAFNHLTLFLWNLGFGQMLHRMKVDEGSNDDESLLNFRGRYSLMFPSRIVEKKLYLPLHGSHPKCRVGIVAQKILKWYGSCTNQKQQLCTRAKLAKNCGTKLFRTVAQYGVCFHKTERLKILSLAGDDKRCMSHLCVQLLTCRQQLEETVECGDAHEEGTEI